VRGDHAAWALCELDLVGVDAETVADIRRQVGQRTGLNPESILVATVHTHSAPNPLDGGNWNRELRSMVTDTIVHAWDNAQPACVASGAGFLYGHSINRRWFERPIDPGVGVLRFDDLSGNLLGVVMNFGLHAVVLGGDNLLISADYVGYVRDAVEEELGGICIFTNGGAGDVNPLTETVRKQLAAGKHFTTMTGAHYYGEGPDAIFIEERKGGTFAEAESLGRSLASEVIRVSGGLMTKPPDCAPWSAQAWVNHLETGKELIEVQALGVGDFALVAHPGEAFAETALATKAALRRLGYRFPWLVSYANDRQSYLVPETALMEGGYEAEQAQRKNHASDVQSRLWTAIRQHLPSCSDSALRF
jgi:hypothetical protein